MLITDYLLSNSILINEVGLKYEVDMVSDYTWDIVNDQTNKCNSPFYKEIQFIPTYTLSY